ncbi:hypothetical protein EX30DRAFT_338948 [Ascodesmis nigricans]|uniref:Chromatin modification-related protein n=1 Tax=Ascodesmis nigricans TaxID=341454 RepID=A0A4S2N5I1_9PEZI|nr:hypothetical protein EX30DRAFT_338948 [Ascodesmis nigricans]
MAAPTEDAASVLEAFISDAANLPAEIAHIYEEIRARDVLLSSARDAYQARDQVLQRYIQKNGSLATDNPKEASSVEQIRKLMKKVHDLQDEKIELTRKAVDLMEKHIRGLDARIAGLVREGTMPADALTPAPMPSNLPVGSQVVMGGGRGLGANIVSAAHRMSVGLSDRRPGMDLSVAAPGPGTPVGAGTPGSALSSAPKRIKLGGSFGNSVAVAAVTGRPGTPRAETTSRAGTPSGHSGTRKTGRKKPPAKRVLDEDADEDDDEEEEEGGEVEDTRLYCVCKQVSFGSMVGCDDKDCPYEWFHWTCVGLTEEPKGKWYCQHCSQKRAQKRNAQAMIGS